MLAKLSAQANFYQIWTENPGIISNIGLHYEIYYGYTET